MQRSVPQSSTLQVPSRTACFPARMKQLSDVHPAQRAETTSEESLMQPAPGAKGGRNRIKCLFTPKSRLDMGVRCTTLVAPRGGETSPTGARVLAGAPSRGRIPVPRALNQAFKIINLITLSILLLSLQLLMFSRCWKGRTQPQISLKAKHPKWQDNTSERNNYFGRGDSEPVQQPLLPCTSPTPWKH